MLASSLAEPWSPFPMSTTDGDALRFDGRTAIITGAGGKPSLGRAHALLLAARGANVVVNDIGHDPETPGYVGRASAESVVDELRSAGGRAVADTHSVASPDGAAAVVATALATFGRLDVPFTTAALSGSAPSQLITPHTTKS